MQHAALDIEAHHQSNTPDVHRGAPRHTENDLRSPVRITHNVATMLGISSPGFAEIAEDWRAAGQPVDQPRWV